MDEAGPWTFGWEALVAIGTLTLAWMTYRLAIGVVQQVGVERDQLIASTRPLVTAIGASDERTGPHVRLQNSGAGTALNVRGSLFWTEREYSGSALQSLVLAPGSDRLAKVLGAPEVNWRDAKGWLRYHDLHGIEWQTHFRFRADMYGEMRVETLLVGETSKLGVPAYSSEGWENRPEGIEVWKEVEDYNV